MLDGQVVTGGDLQETAVGCRRRVFLLDQPLRVRAILRTRRDTETGVFIVQRATGELFDTRGMDAVVLPVPVSADDFEVTNLILLQPGEESNRFVAEPLRSA